MAETRRVRIDVATLWATPEEGDILTQALVGEPVELVAESNGWVEVVLPWQPSATDPRGYRGWLREDQLTDLEPPVGPPAAVAVPSVRANGRALSYGCVLPVVAESADSVNLWFPGGTAEVPRTSIAGPGPHRPADVLASARQFLGLAYLWGGTSGWALDCSGLVHLVHRVHGMCTPRDASDQHAASRPVDLADVHPGDLYFFAREGKPAHHVGLVSDEGRMLHAPQTGASVEDAPLNTERRATLVGAGTFLR